MKKILFIEDDVYNLIKTEVTVYNLTWAGGTTIPIQFLTKLIGIIEEGNTEYHFEFKNKEGKHGR